MQPVHAAEARHELRLQQLGGGVLEHPQVALLLLPPALPGGPAAEDGLVADAARRLARQLLHALLLCGLLVRCLLRLEVTRLGLSGELPLKAAIPLHSCLALGLVLVQLLHCLLLLQL